MFARCLLGLAACLALSMAVGAGDHHALVIGVDAVPNFKVGGVMAVRPLRGAEYDARSFADTLVNYWAFPEGRVQLLLGGDATHAAVTAAMERIATEAKPDDSVLFYFAGHGTQAPDQAPLDEPPDERLDEALCLSDANSEGENLLLDDGLAKWMRRLKVRGITIMLDCCHSGTGIKGPDGEPIERGLTLPSVAAFAGRNSSGPAWGELELVRKAGGPRVIALYACEASQSAYERRFETPQGPQPMGQFTRFLLEAMRDQSRADSNSDGRLSVEEAAAYVAAQIDRDFNAGRPAPKRQTPHYEAARGTWELSPAL